VAGRYRQAGCPPPTSPIGTPGLSETNSERACQELSPTLSAAREYIKAGPIGAALHVLVRSASCPGPVPIPGYPARASAEDHPRRARHLNRRSTVTAAWSSSRTSSPMGGEPRQFRRHVFRAVAERRPQRDPVRRSEESPWTTGARPEAYSHGCGAPVIGEWAYLT
jgi:hypothetical protein